MEIDHHLSALERHQFASVVPKLHRYLVEVVCRHLEIFHVVRLVIHVSRGVARYRQNPQHFTETVRHYPFGAHGAAVNVNTRQSSVQVWIVRARGPRGHPDERSHRGLDHESELRVKRLAQSYVDTSNVRVCGRFLESYFSGRRRLEKAYVSIFVPSYGNRFGNV